MTRPAIGATRVSTGPQARMYGQDVQAQEIAAYAQRQGYELLEIIPEVISGRTDPEGRATVQRYLELARPGITFIFPRVDRIGRRAEYILNIVRQLQERGPDVDVVGVPADLRTKEGMLMLTVLAGMAEYDHGSIRERMDSGRRRKAQAGLWPHGAAPWGYRLSRDERGVAQRPEPVPEQAAAVLRLFELAVEHGEATLLRTMRAEGWPAPTAAGWVAKSVHNILQNPVYAGRRTYQGITLEFEPIVPPELVAQVSQARAERRMSGGPAPAAPLLWTGHVRCICGAAIGRDQARTRGREGVREVYPTYRCWKGKKGAPGRHAGEHAARLVDDLWWGELVGALSDPATLAQVVRPSLQPVPLDSRRVAELEAAISRAYEPLTAGAVGYTLAIAQDLARPYADQLAQLRAEHAAQAQPEAPDAQALARGFRTALKRPLGFEDRRALLDSLRVQLTVGPDGVQGVTLVVP